MEMPDAVSLFHQTTFIAARHSFAAVGACLVVAPFTAAPGPAVFRRGLGRFLVDEPAGGGAVERQGIGA
ncbi:hypothetical protein D3C84_1013470 [compost metagenome]